MRIVAFIGSPVASEEKELVKLAKKLKKEKVNVDVISFGEDATNSEVLTVFINTLNGKVSNILYSTLQGNWCIQKTVLKFLLQC